MNRRSLYQIFSALWLLLLATPVAAHGGGILQVASEPTGPYAVSVWTSPARLEAGELAHITVGIAGPDEAPVLGATVLVELISLATGEVITSAAATTAQATNKLFYEADMRLPGDGRYMMTFHIEGAEGSGELSFAIEVLPERETNWVLLALIGVGLVLSMVMFRLWEKQTSGLSPRKR